MTVLNFKMAENGKIYRMTRDANGIYTIPQHIPRERRRLEIENMRVA